MFQISAHNGCKRTSPYRTWLDCLVCGIGLLLLIAAGAWAQVEYTLTLTDPAGVMTIEVEDPVTLRWIEEDTRMFWQRPAAHFQFRTAPLAPTGGDPTKTGDENKRLCSDLLVPINDLYSFSSKIEFSIDQTNVDLTGMYVDIHDLGDAAAPVPHWEVDIANFWPVPLSAGVRDIWGVGRIPLAEEEEEEEEEPEAAAGVNQWSSLMSGLLQPAKVGLGAGAPVGGPPWVAVGSRVGPAQTGEGPWIDVEHRFKIVHDLLMLELIVVNKDSQTHYVGTRIFFDGSFGGIGYFDGEPFILPSGQAITTERVLPDEELDIPDYWVSISDPEKTSVRSLLDTPEVYLLRGATYTAGLPDAIEFGEWSSLTRAWFDFRPNTNLSLLDADWAYAVKWNEQRLLPGQSRRYVTFYGLGAATANYEPYVAGAFYGPRRLVKQQGDDPATVVVEGVDHYYLSDEEGLSPFPIHFYANNFGAQPVFGAQAVIELPDGLELWPDTQQLHQSLGTISPNELAGVTWTVRAVYPRPGMVEIEASGAGKLLRHKLFVPALPVLPPRPAVLDLEMLSIPYDFFNTDAQHVFQSLGDLTGGGANDPALYRWEPAASQYRQFPHEFFANVVPGHGYWVYNPTEATLVLPDDAEELPDEAVGVTLPKGWNQIGSPFVLTVRLDSIQVVRSDTAEVYDLYEAVAHNLLQPVLFSYNPTSNEYEWETDLTAARLDPFEGYWLLARRNIFLIIPPPSLVVPVQAEAPLSELSESAGWQVQLEVAGAGRVCADRAFGVDEVAEEGLDRRDVPSPPSASGSGATLQAEFVSLTHQAPPCLVDVRPLTQTEQTWYLAITTDAPDQFIRVSWPSLEALPADMIAILEDTASGQKIWMRTNSAYSYNSSEGGLRLLKISVRSVDSITPVVSQVTATAAAGGSWAISYSLSSAAAVQARIRNISGVVVKHLVSGELNEAGRNVVLWSGRSDRGTAVPSGRYLIEIEARSPDTGQTGRIISAFAVMR